MAAMKVAVPPSRGHAELGEAMGCRLNWFAENLKTTRFQNGDSIPNVSDAAEWTALKSAGMCSYQNDPTYDCPYGKLYNFYVATDARNPCPAGWRVPTKVDYDKLINYYDADANGGAPSAGPNIAGGFLKSTGTTLWRTPNQNATNLSGFSAIPSGGQNDNGLFSKSSDAAAAYWYASEVGPGMGFFLELTFNHDFAVRDAFWAKYGACIRCVADVATSVHQERQTGLHVSPNPANELLSVSVEARMIGQEFIIADVTGRAMLRGTITSERMTISISDLPAGLYLMRYQTIDGGTMTFVKQ